MPLLIKLRGAVFGPAMMVFLMMTNSSAVYASEGGEGLPQFNAEWFPSQIFWLAVTFCILYTFFSTIALPRIASTIHDRQRKIQSDLDRAAELSTKAKAIREHYERNMVKAKERASDALRQADISLKAKTADFLYTYRTKFTQEVARTENELLGIRARLVTDMNNIAAELAAQATGHILQTPADLNQAQAVVTHLNKNKQAA